MPRPSRHTDRALLDSGKKLLPVYGVSRLSIRQVAEEAGVNLGMFHYHFKTKEQFSRIVLQEIYEEFFAVFSSRLAQTSDDPDPLNRLRTLVQTIAGFAYPNRKFLLSIARDLLSGETVTLEFLHKNVPRHALPMLEVLKDCRDKKLIRTDLSLFQTVIQIILGVAGPLLAGTALEHLAGKLLPKRILQDLVAEKHIAQRIEFVLSGLKGTG